MATKAASPKNGKGVQGGSPEQHAEAGRKGGANSTGPKKKADADDGRHDNPGRPKGSKNSK
ncbi:MAG TPA: hypothetical protein VK404_14610 [Spirosoma sp.]|jgi:general stress protein YciG|nr:hypothetical protein [Spirosoma sp.]